MTETVAVRTRFVCEMVVKTARLMVGVPDYDNYAARRRERRGTWCSASAATATLTALMKALTRGIVSASN
jgi:hypothetical protein